MKQEANKYMNTSESKTFPPFKVGTRVGQVGDPPQHTDKQY